MAIINPPEFAANSAYTAKRWRAAMEHMSTIQPGAWDLNSFTVTAGTGWGVNVSGGSAFVNATAGTLNKGLYHIEGDTTPIPGTLTAAHPTLPRIDQVSIQIDDAVDGAAADNDPQILVSTGTPTSGATLGNRTGAATLPGNTLLLADILVPAGSGSIAAATIRDRRTLARGALSIQTLTAADITSAGPTGTPVEVGKVRMNIGQAAPPLTNAVEFGVAARVQQTINGTMWFRFQRQASDSGTWITIGPGSGRYLVRQSWNSGLLRQTYYFDTYFFSPANHQFRLALYSSGNLTLSASNATQPLRWWVREIPRGLDNTIRATP